jgi:hypothetical protein
MALHESKKDRQWLNVKGGFIQRPYKVDDEWHYTDHPAIDGLVTDLKITDKTDSQGNDYKQLEVEIYDEKYFVLCSRMFKPFSDGLMMSLGNADLTKVIRISPYKGEAKKGKNAPTYCSVRYPGEKEAIKWIDGIPATELIDAGAGEKVPLRKERNEALLKLFDVLKEKALANKAIIEKNTSNSTEEPVHTAETEYSEGELD